MARAIKFHHRLLVYTIFLYYTRFWSQ